MSLHILFIGIIAALFLVSKGSVECSATLRGPTFAPLRGSFIAAQLEPQPRSRPTPPAGPQNSPQVRLETTTDVASLIIPFRVDSISSRGAGIVFVPSSNAVISDIPSGQRFRPIRPTPGFSHCRRLRSRPKRDQSLSQQTTSLRYLPRASHTSSSPKPKPSTFRSATLHP